MTLMISVGIGKRSEPSALCVAETEDPTGPHGIEMAITGARYNCHDRHDRHRQLQCVAAIGLQVQGVRGAWSSSLWRSDLEDRNP